jgi:dolichol-phosphate mannosyltransferase
MEKNLVIIPTYNELGNIGKMVRAVMAANEGFHLLIVDDGSPDGTAAQVKIFQQEYPDRLFLEERLGKLGLGTAYIHGFKWALARDYSHIFEMDCDFSHDPGDLVRLLAACRGGADLAIGSRYCKGGKVRNWPLGRIFMSYFASVYVRLVLWIPVKDTTAGFKCYKRKVLSTIELDKVHFMGYAFQIEMKYRAYKKGFKLVEVPILFTDRVIGVSKMSTKIFKEAFLGVLQMRFSI